MSNNKIASYLDLTARDFFRKTRSELCKVISCNSGGGGLTSVSTQDTASVTFVGNGTVGNPLKATANIPVPTTPNLSAVLTSGNTANNMIILSNGTLSTALLTSGIQLSSSSQTGTYTRAYSSYIDTSGNTTTIQPNPSLTTSVTVYYPTDPGTLVVDSSMKHGFTTFSVSSGQSVYLIPHGLGSVPSTFLVTFEDATDANLFQSVRTVDDTNIIITCTSPPLGIPSTNGLNWLVFK